MVTIQIKISEEANERLIKELASLNRNQRRGYTTYVTKAKLISTIIDAYYGVEKPYNIKKKEK